MSLQRIGESETLRAIQARCRANAEYLRRNPEVASEIEARAQADRDALNRALQRPVEQPAIPERHSRSAMRKRKELDEEDIL